MNLSLNARVETAGFSISVKTLYVVEIEEVKRKINSYCPSVIVESVLMRSDEDNKLITFVYGELLYPSCYPPEWIFSNYCCKLSQFCRQIFAIDAKKIIVWNKTFKFKL
jgi:hypothetical protein